MSALLLSARQISRRYGARTVLDSVDLRVASDVRIGLVGPERIRQVDPAEDPRGT